MTSPPVSLDQSGNFSISDNYQVVEKNPAGGAMGER
jgi:hypothetical protein